MSNQVFSIEEDSLNKADRPLPAGRITVQQARVLRWTLVPLCLILSLLYSAQVACASATFIILGIIYNEFHAHAGHWTVRNVMNASGFAALEAGATLVAGKPLTPSSSTPILTHLPTGLDQCQLDSTAKLAICLSAAIFASTYHVQDFKDIDGDRLMGRQTLPIVQPQHARKTVIVGLMAWSVALVAIWQLDVVAAALLLSLAAITGVRFLVYRTVPGDQVSFYLYNVRGVSYSSSHVRRTNNSLLVGLALLRSRTTCVLETSRLGFLNKKN